MNPDRRAFLRTALILSGAVAVTRRVLSQAPTAAASEQTDLFSRMSWFNEPSSFKVSGTELLVHSRPKTDFWRKTFYGYTTDNGHFFHLAVDGDFSFLARINAGYAALYDQAGLMIRLDAENWMKSGTEFFDGRRHASVVFTRGYSDWSTMPDLSDTAPVWWKAVRQKDAIETLCSLDGKNFASVRQGYFPPAVKVEVGIMCAAPEGPGFDATFDNLALTALR